MTTLPARSAARIALVAAFLCLTAAGAGAIGLNIDGTWSFVLDAADISGSNPGATFVNQVSTNGTIDLDVSGALGNWRIDVRKIDVDWGAAAAVAVRRTNGGTGSGTAPSGGTAYLTLTSADQQLFTGNLDRTNIRIQYRVIPNILSTSAKVYTTTIWFTVTDI